MLPMPQAKLKALTPLHNDDIIFFNVPSHPLSQYSRELLDSNLDSLLYLQQEGSFTPVIFSDGLLNGINPENILTLSITEDILEMLASADLKLLGNISVGFIDFIEKNLERLEPHFKKKEYAVNNPYNDALNILSSVHSLFLSFSAMYWDKQFGVLYVTSNKIRGKMRDYFAELEISNSIVGLCQQFLQSLQKEILAGAIKTQSTQTPWNPDTMSKTTILTDELHLLIPPELFTLLVKQTFCQVQELAVLKALEKNDFLLADNSGIKHYKKYAGYINPDGKKMYRRFVILHSDVINLTYGPRIV